MFFEEGKVDRGRLLTILGRHRLLATLDTVDHLMQGAASAADLGDAGSTFNARAKASLRADLRAKTWPEKILAMERMRARPDLKGRPT